MKALREYDIRSLDTDEKFVNTTVLLRHLPLGLVVPFDMFRILVFLSFKYKIRVEVKVMYRVGYVASEEDHGHQAQHQIKTFNHKANTSDPSNTKAVSKSLP